MKLNKHPELLKVGQTVVSDFNVEDRLYVIVEIEESNRCSSGRYVRARAIDTNHDSIYEGIDSSWFRPATPEAIVTAPEDVDLSDNMYTPPSANIVDKFGGQTLGLGDVLYQMLTIYGSNIPEGFNTFKDFQELLNFMLKVTIPEKT